MDLVVLAVVNGIAWGRNVIGLIVRPYEASRRIAERGRYGELGYIVLLSCLYFVLISIVKVASFRPFLLTREFLTLCAGALAGYAGIVAALSVAAKMVRATPKFSSLAVSWGYTLLPTVSWFFMTSFLSVLFPPPRTTSAAGVLFSIVFLAVSAMLLWWKLMLSYLAVRFTMRITAARCI